MLAAVAKVAIAGSDEIAVIEARLYDKVRTAGRGATWGPREMSL